MADYSLMSSTSGAINNFNTTTANRTNSNNNTDNSRTNSNNVTSSSTSSTGYTKSSTTSAANDALGKNSFLQLLVAQITNLDPTQDQDSTAYVTQLAQFSSMEQLYNLNQTMTTFAYQSLIGKGATVEENDKTQYTGIIRGVSIDGGGNYSLALEINNNGTNEIKIFPVSKLVSVLDSSDNSTNNEMLLNSAFSTASALADRNNKVVVYDKDSNGNTIYTKGVVKGAYIENGDVKIRVETLNADGTTTGQIKTYSYSSIYKAGDLTQEDMNVTAPETGTTNGTDSGSTSTETEASAGSNNENIQTESTESVDSANNAAGNMAAVSANETGNSDAEINQQDIERENSILQSIAGE